MKRLASFLLLCAAPGFAQVIGGGVTIGAGVTIGGITQTPILPTSLISFSPIGGHYTSAQSIALSTTLAGDSLFYTADGSPATEASVLYGAPFAISASKTVNALAVAPPIVAAQSLQNCVTGTCWKTQIAANATQEAPYIGNFHCPAIAYGSGSGANAGVAGIPTACNLVTGVASPSLSGDATHFSFETENISGAGSETQVLIANKQPGANGATYQVEDFDEYPGEGASDFQAIESDLVDWDTSRNLILSAALQCNYNGGYWQFNGQAGSWNNFGFDQNNHPIVIYKNGTALAAGTKITEGCGPSMLNNWTHVQYHATFNPNKLDCTDVTTTLPTECVYIDYLAIDSDRYTFGTTSATDQAGHAITVSILKVPAAALPSGYPARCFNQFQIDGKGTGASVSHPVTYGLYLDQVNMSCGTGVVGATNSQQYTF